ncbi:glycosyltransferase family 2 protein [Solemya velum gill symbiont]|uniref:glycosyltransferase family 2 protein n=1 Tax=Solemya velum gill symbiont TaxID=2340 RepID=UPI0009980FFD|nr:glycosyltransferase family 2 protein [Solemya velum gill symbiont]OOZ44785.1 hypothetical protein BOW37_05760 [Solemya velum gill symbiont]OOZ51858.1 hypothetical protein BOW40_05815 [Solemya velum gill symbiont]OOZ54401.1 hypothetical protein BOW41_06525 [Solemya velum gill symbiont]
MDNKIAAIVVLYNPGISFIDNINTYSKYVDNIIVIDNSSANNHHLLAGFQTLTYIPLNENMGISSALNIGCNKAIELKCNLALTMDQDSSFEKDQITRFISLSNGHFTNLDIAIVAPSWLCSQSVDLTVECNSVITSGNLVRLSAWQSIGGYNEDYFIDEVDHEFCYRLRDAGYKIVLLGNVSIRHNLGNPLLIKWFGRTITSSNHSVDRRYYLTRNRLLCRRDHPQYKRPFISVLFRDVVNILLVEPHKLRKLWAIACGFYDYKIGRAGKRP